MNEINDLDRQLIERCLADAADAESRRLFDSKMTSDPAFAEEVVFLKNLRAALAEEDELALKNDLQAVETRLAEPRKSAKIIALTPRFWWAAAAVLLAVLAAVVVFRGRSAASPEQMFAENFAPYPNLEHPTLRENGATLPDSLLAWRFYNEKNWASAADKFARLPATNATNFYRANALLAAGEAEMAIPLLEKVLKNESGSYAQAARWYMALAFLKTGDTAQATIFLKKISETPGHFRAREAADLLKKSGSRTG